MKSYLTPLLFTVASLTAISANAGAPSYFIPTEPTVTAPADQASNVSLTPEFTSSEFQFSEASVTPTLSKSNWVLSKKSDNITITSSPKASDSDSNSSNFTFEYAIPFPISISGQVADKIKVTSRFTSPAPSQPPEEGLLPPGEGPLPSGPPGSYIQLLSSTGNVIATADIGFNGFYFQTEKSFVISKAFSNALLFQWHLKNAQGTEIVAEFTLADGGLNGNDIFGWRITPNELTNTLFSTSDSGASCRIAANNSTSIPNTSPPMDTPTFIGNSLSDWKTHFSNKGKTTFSLACLSQASEAAEREGEFDLAYGSFTAADVTGLLAEVNIFSSTTENHTLNDGEALNLSTEYTAQVQHIGVFDENTGASSWSVPVSFTTRAADTNYQVTAPTDLAFTTGVAKDLAFKISNTGSEAGAPQVTIRLPFEVLSALNGTLADFFSVSVGGKNCAMNQSGGKTDFVCQLDSLAAAAEVELAAKVTVQDTAISKIEYQVCDTAKCAATAFTAVDITVTAAPTDPAPEASSSSSSGGSMFWLFLMAPLLLVRRK